MSYVSQLTGGSSIGDTAFSPDVGSSLTKLNGEIWGRSGVYFNPATYTAAATIEYLKAVGNSASHGLSYGGAALGDIATDGAGRWVIAYQSATNVMVSTDNGATWANVAHNAGGAVVSVSYDSTNGVFIAAGNSTTAFFVSSVAAASVGSAWTARTGTAITGGTANTAKVRSLSGVSVIVCSGGTTGNASRSTNGTTWAAINLAASLGASAGWTRLLPIGGSVWIAGGGDTTIQRSTDNGLTFASATTPGNFYGYALKGGTILAYSSADTFYTSLTGATGSWTLVGSIRGYSGFLSQGDSLYADSTNYYLPVSIKNTTTYASDGRVAYSSDGITWKVKTVINRPWNVGAVSSVRALLGVATNGDFVMSPLGSATSAAYGNFNTTTGVGLQAVVSELATGSYNGPSTLYVRIG